MSETRTVSPTLEERLAGVIFEVEIGTAKVDFPDVVTGSFDDLDSPYPRQMYINRAHAILAAAKEHGLVIGEGELDAAWREAIAALPEGWAIDRVTRVWDQGPVSKTWRAWANRGDGSLVSEYGPTPAAALKALTAKLRDSRR